MNQKISPSLWSKHIGSIKKGQKIGNWTILSSTLFSVKKSQGRWICAHVRCKCGLEDYKQINHLLKNVSLGCRNCRKMPKGSDNHSWKGYGNISAHYFWLVKNSAKKRNIPFKLTIKYMNELYEKQKKHCKLTNREICFGFGSQKNTTASLDRIDSNKGYIKGNVQWVCKQINIAKHVLSMDEFVHLCSEVSNYCGPRKLLYRKNIG